jgi:hypothetical protein
LAGHVADIEATIDIRGFSLTEVWSIASRDIPIGTRPSVYWDTWQQSTKSGKVPKGSTPSENRRSQNQGGKEPKHQKSRNPDSRYPDTIWTVRSQQIWTVEKSKGDFSRFGDLKVKEREKPAALYH